MKLYYKLALINSFTRILIIAGFLVFLPGLIYQAAVTHVDSRLSKKESKIMHIVNKTGMGEFISESTDTASASDSTYADYTIFKENFISLVPVKEAGNDTIVTSPRDIEGEIIESRILIHYFKYDRTNWLLEIGESMQYVEDLQHHFKKNNLLYTFNYSNTYSAYRPWDYAIPIDSITKN